MFSSVCADVDHCGEARVDNVVDSHVCADIFGVSVSFPGHGGRLKASRADCQLYSKISELPELQITADYQAGCSYTVSVSICARVCVCVCHAAWGC